MLVTKTRVFGNPGNSLNIIAVDRNIHVPGEARRIWIALAHLEKYGHPSHDSIIHFGLRQSRVQAPHQFK